MVRNVHERILLIADSRREIEPILSSAIPSAQVTRVETYFDGIAELSGGGYTAVIAAAEPIERAPPAGCRGGRPDRPVRRAGARSPVAKNAERGLRRLRRHPAQRRRAPANL